MGQSLQKLAPVASGAAPTPCDHAHNLSVCPEYHIVVGIARVFYPVAVPSAYRRTWGIEVKQSKSGATLQYNVLQLHPIPHLVQP